MAEMTLDQTDVEAHTLCTGEVNFYPVEGQSIKIETSPGGDDILDHEVPAPRGGMRWACTVNVRLIEIEEVP